ncbi:PIN-like domain-containing protein [Leeuwenhoekiella blandensis]|uniref:VapC45 PIN like domain-containing protein n=1 Tax=Leeuwenhoekiella blandensis (strain CECT 7118 / CCUG 51940 / KCTC 22103 / MED217) TaxID=398720 RepID=A3XPU4_LEEBM|nr:hypothetical protein [Leeuwenhoekiella blandensis]EAQ48425.1 hypothetical protein MED217_12999 [Leeuwenhoekiella blandensis MED217]
MIIYFDENMPPHLAKGFRTIQNVENLKRKGKVFEIELLKDKFGYGVKDIEWIAQLKNNNSFIITRDIHLDKRKDEIAAYHEAGIGLFFIRGASKKANLSVWDMLLILSKQWEEIIKIVSTRKTPFSFQVTYSGKPKQMR